MTSSHKTSLDAEVAIIGAGAAGLTAALQLQARGRSFVLLEASHRIGGRAYTEDLQPGIPFDLGAHWIHSDELNPFFQIAAEQGATLQRDDEDYTAAAYFEDGEWLDESSTVEFGEFFERQFETVVKAARANSSQSVFDVVDNNSRWAPYFYTFFGQDFSCDVDQISVQDVADYVFGGVDQTVASGFGNLIHQYGMDVPVSLNSAVQEIDWSGPGVRLMTTKGELRVGKVIITVSTGVMATQQITFKPQLPDWKIEAISSLPMGSHTRVGLTFEDRFLNDLPDDFTVRMGEDEPLHFRNRPCGYDFVEIVTGGRLAEWMEKSGEVATLDFINVRLKQLLGNEAKLNPSRHIVTAWDRDAWTKGAYSYALPGGGQQRERLAESIDEKLFFAGEATSRDFFATVHGAYFSAIDAVNCL
jgi:monoamine oxidase